MEKRKRSISIKFIKINGTLCFNEGRYTHCPRIDMSPLLTHQIMSLPIKKIRKEIRDFNIAPQSDSLCWPSCKFTCPAKNKLMKALRKK